MKWPEPTAMDSGRVKTELDARVITLPLLYTRTKEKARGV